MSPPALAGRRVVVTRPAGQTGHMAALIRAAGGEPVLFPALEILDAGDLQPVLALIDRLDVFDLAIFISANAVNRVQYCPCCAMQVSVIWVASMMTHG